MLGRMLRASRFSPLATRALSTITPTLRSSSVPCSILRVRIDETKEPMRLSLLAGVLAGALLSEAEKPECAGKRKKKDSVLPDELYEVETIKARRLSKGKPEYLIHWKGFEDKHDSWEPLDNLAGIEPDLAAFETKQKKDQEEFAAQLAARKAAKAAATAP
jgi:hypothetical protein